MAARPVSRLRAASVLLTPVEQAHLRDLAEPTSRSPRTTATPQRGDPGLLRLMDALNHLPVLLLGSRAQILARNALLRAVLGHGMEPGSSFVRFLFQHPIARQRITNWADFASVSVATMRREAGRHPDDAMLIALIDEPRRADPDFARWWEDHTVRDYASVAKQIQHPSAGTLLFDIEIVSAPLEPDQRLVVYTAQPDSTTARLPAFGEWWHQERPAQLRGVQSVTWRSVGQTTLRLRRSGYHLALLVAVLTFGVRTPNGYVEVVAAAASRRLSCGALRISSPAARGQHGRSRAAGERLWQQRIQQR